MPPAQRPIEVTQRTRFTVNVIGVVAIVGATLTVAQALNGIRSELKELRADSVRASTERWTAEDMERWCYAFDRANASKGVAIPNPRDPLIRVREKH